MDADLTQVPEAGQVTALDPFGGNSQRVTWERPVNVGQLQEEMLAALGEGVHMAVCPPLGEQGEDVEVDAAHPLTLFVSPSTVALAEVRKVLAAHRLDPYYGLTPEQVAEVQLREKIASGAELSAREMQDALRLLMS